MIKINNFRGDLSSISVRNKALLATCSSGERCDTRGQKMVCECIFVYFPFLSFGSSFIGSRILPFASAIGHTSTFIPVCGSTSIFPSSSWSCQCPCGCGIVVKRYIIISILRCSILDPQPVDKTVLGVFSVQIWGLIDTESCQDLCP